MIHGNREQLFPCVPVLDRFMMAISLATSQDEPLADHPRLSPTVIKLEGGAN